MKLLKKNLIYISFLMALITYSQTAFKKGYFINNSGEKTECYIEKNMWRRSPLKIKYKITLEEKPKDINLKKIREFGIYNVTKYIKRQVEIGKSSNILNKLDNNEDIIFTKEQVFLKVLVQGVSNLYVYEEKGFKLYFFDTQTSKIKQLVYKKYYKNNNKLSENTFFRRQLFDNLKCEALTLKEIKDVRYIQKDLENIFMKYNQCLNPNYKNNLNNKKPTNFKFNIRPGVNFSSLEIQNTYSDETTNFGNMTRIRLGVEMEFFLPLKNNNWAAIFEPSFHTYKAEGISGGQLSPQLPKETKVDYKSLEIHLGIRYNASISRQSLLFLNAGLISDFPLDSTVKFEKLNDFDRTTDIDLVAAVNAAFGFGYKYNKYSIEYRYQTSRNNSTASGGIWKSNYSVSSLILGYNFF